MTELKYTLFGIGTLAFFAAVYLAIQHPQLVDGPDKESQKFADAQLMKWDKAITWTMWVTWGCVGLIIFLDKSGFLETFE